MVICFASLWVIIRGCFASPLLGRDVSLLYSTALGSFNLGQGSSFAFWSPFLFRSCSGWPRSPGQAGCFGSSKWVPSKSHPKLNPRSGDFWPVTFQGIKSAGPCAARPMSFLRGPRQLPRHTPASPHAQPTLAPTPKPPPPVSPILTTQQPTQHLLYTLNQILRSRSSAPDPRPSLAPIQRHEQENNTPAEASRHERHREKRRGTATRRRRERQNPNGT